MNDAFYYKVQRQMDRAQEAYDNMMPPEWDDEDEDEDEEEYEDEGPSWEDFAAEEHESYYCAFLDHLYGDYIK